MPAADLVHHENREDDDACHDPTEHAEAAPVTRIAAVHDAVHQHEQTHDRDRYPNRVDAPRRRIAGFGNEGEDAGDAENDDRHVDEEYRSPPEVLEEEAAKDRADRDGCTDGAGPQTYRPTSLRRREDHRDDGEGHGQHGRSADAHEPAEHDQLGRRCCERRQRRRHAKQQQPDDQDALTPVPIPQDAPREQQRREHHDVGVDRPHQLALRGGETDLDRLQRHVEDRVVEDDDQQAGHEDAEDRPASRMTVGEVGRDLLHPRTVRRDTKRFRSVS